MKLTFFNSSSKLPFFISSKHFWYILPFLCSLGIALFPSRTAASDAPFSAVPPGISLSHQIAQLQDRKPQSSPGIASGDFAPAVTAIEGQWETVFEDYFGRNLSEVTLQGEEIGEALALVEQKTGQKSAVIYMIPGEDQLELLLVTADGGVTGRTIAETNQEMLKETAQQLRQRMTSPSRRSTQSYLPQAQQLYTWMIAPLRDELQSRGIENLLLCVGPGLRSVPFAALHDGEKFLVEQYSLALIPAFNMIDLNPSELANTEVLAMGASLFKTLSPLPAVPVELSRIARYLWPGEVFLNQDFTQENLQSQLQESRYGIVHLATHADFNEGNPAQSYIQLWDSQLTLDNIHQLKLHESAIRLLVLSACNTAVGSQDAEKGFAGLAIQSGVPSALASLWYVSDLGTLALMSEFYNIFKTDDDNSRSLLKAEALREAQLAMLRGEVRLEEGNLVSDRGVVPLPEELGELTGENLAHPYFWAGFTLIGSPW
ncbi:CHAT domain-containing protein [Laspinema olomoucense]|uniref:CHAT domain-containing protein n=1 Tax=Laspinema olomoucense TaxID=3231600 RepID=UPI0021BA67E3|nr:CHAT domain-containing protein [Laspinema sp. D3d]MCT7974368.1 CHAT domain-containing protein [Laspinema sp. D3d]